MNSNRLPAVRVDPPRTRAVISAPTGLRVSGPPAGPLPYWEFIHRVGRRARIDADEARDAIVVTITALARIVGPADRDRLLGIVPPPLCAAIPARFHEDYPVDLPYHRRAGTSIVVAVGGLTHRSLQEAQRRAWAVLSVITEYRRALIASLDLPPDVRALTEWPVRDGGPDARRDSPPLTNEEMDETLDGLRHWFGDQRALCRIIDVPFGTLDRVIDRLHRLGRELGCGPRIGRQGDTTAVLILWTPHVDCVTDFDVAVARRVDAVLNDAGL
jgi:pterin-4a-carbinolamine dehydratase